jgi:hypothetical protein
MANGCAHSTVLCGPLTKNGHSVPTCETRQKLKLLGVIAEGVLKPIGSEETKMC